MTLLESAKRLVDTHAPILHRLADKATDGMSDDEKIACIERGGREIKENLIKQGINID